MHSVNMRGNKYFGLVYVIGKQTSCSEAMNVHFTLKQPVAFDTKYIVFYLLAVATSWKVAGSIPKDVIILLIYLILPATIWPWSRLSI
jgi:hypothetical protein